jgi:hypothetical protein
MVGALIPTLGYSLSPDVSCDGILEDEARHLGFNHIYMEDRFRDFYVQDRTEGAAKGQADHLHARLNAVLDMVPPIFDALNAEMKSAGIDREALFGRVREEACERLNKSIQTGRLLAERADAAD